jgi:hypothetical protein
MGVYLSDAADPANAKKTRIERTDYLGFTLGITKS